MSNKHTSSWPYSAPPCQRCDGTGIEPEDATAPELLAALQNLVAGIEHMAREAGIASCDITPDVELHEARAAIAKAKARKDQKA